MYIHVTYRIAWIRTEVNSFPKRSQYTYNECIKLPYIILEYCVYRSRKTIVILSVGGLAWSWQQQVNS